MSDDQLFGREATEAAQGYTPMPEPVADKPDPELEHAQAIERIIDRDPPSPIVERKYVRADDDSKPQPDNRTVELDRAAEDLAQNRIAEAAIAEIERDLQLANEIDAARGQAQPEATEPQQPVAQPEPLQQSAPADGVDPDVAAAFRNPKVLAVLEQHHLENTAKVESAVSAATAKADYAVNQATAWAQNNAAVAVAAIIARPELQGVPPGQYAGALQALKVSNPAAHADIERQITNTQAVIQQATQALGQQQRRHAVAFHEWGKANDDAFDRSMASKSPETIGAIKQTSLQMLRDGGLSDLEIAHHWNSNPVMRSALGQQVLADAARWRMAKAGIKPAPKPVPQVARPGSSMDRPAASDRNAFELENRYRGPLSAKQAAELVIGRRARAR